MSMGQIWASHLGFNSVPSLSYFYFFEFSLSKVDEGFPIKHLNHFIQDSNELKNLELSHRQIPIIY